MHLYTDVLLHDLIKSIADLGRDGGSISPSVYDTAQVLRLYPPPEGVEPGLKWLLSKQQADGGWGTPTVPLHRDMPTLAAVLALRTYSSLVRSDEEVEAGLAFLRRQSSQWTAPLPDDIPVAAELIIPKLAYEARAFGLDLPVESYRDLVRIGRRKRRIIDGISELAGTPFAYSWEAWGTEPVSDLLDPLGSVSSSPSATAAWLRAARTRDGLENERQRAEAYLGSANSAIGEIPGLSSIAWPLDRFEQAFALHALMNGGINGLPEVEVATRSCIGELSQALTRRGLGLNDHFMADADTTGAAVAVLAASGNPSCADIQLRFSNNGHFCTYKREFQASISAAARSIDALRMAGRDVSVWQRNLAQMQSADGAWTGDKWNYSWLYTTCIALNALKGSVYHHSKMAALHKLTSCQNKDGGFSSSGSSNMLETAFGLLALHALRDDISNQPELDAATHGSHRWLLSHYLDGHKPVEEIWTSKQIYSPKRIDKIFILSALVGTAMQPTHHPQHGRPQRELLLFAA